MHGNIIRNIHTSSAGHACLLNEWPFNILFDGNLCPKNQEHRSIMHVRAYVRLHLSKFQRFRFGLLLKLRNVVPFNICCMSLYIWRSHTQYDENLYELDKWTNTHIHLLYYSLEFVRCGPKIHLILQVVMNNLCKKLNLEIICGFGQM